MLDLWVTAGGIDTPHQRGYCHEHLKGVDYWLLTCFHTPFFAQLGGAKVEGKIGGCLLNSPQTPLIHGPTEAMTKGFVNDWIFFGGADAHTLIKHLELPVNEIFYPGDIINVREQTELTLDEWQKMLPESRLMQALHLAQLLIELRRGMTSGKTDDDAFRIFTDVRTKMLSRAGEKWSLSQMAGMSGYSVSRFTMLYRQYFGSSPTADLIRARVARARNLLLSGTQSIGSISDDCGFSSVQYFTRTYRAITGESPSETRRGKI